MKKVAQAIEIAVLGQLKLHRNLSYDSYFSEYSRLNDGRVVFATYSFNGHAFDALAKLMPFSTFYISENKKAEAELFLRRFPLYVVYLVPELHVKACWFEESRQMLIGSENLYGGMADYEELSCEFEVQECDKEKVFKLAFDFDTCAYLQVKYSKADIRIYDNSYPGVAGKPYLPCHAEIDYWNRISSDDQVREVGPHYIYCILEYQVDGDILYLAFDRHYQFCGALAADAFKFLSATFRLKQQSFSFLSEGNSLTESSPFKDHFAKFHPIARDRKAERAHYITYGP